MSEKNVEITQEQMKELMSAIDETELAKSDLTYVFEPLTMDEVELSKFVNTEEYLEGLRISAKYSGMYAGLTNSGMALEVATEIVMTQQISDNNLKLQALVNEGIKAQATVVKSQGL